MRVHAGYRQHDTLSQHIIITRVQRIQIYLIRFENIFHKLHFYVNAWLYSITLAVNLMMMMMMMMRKKELERSKEEHPLFNFYETFMCTECVENALHFSAMFISQKWFSIK